MKNFFSYFIIISLIVFTSCKSNSNSNSHKLSEKSGGSFKFPGTNEVKTLLPCNITMESEGVVVTQIHEGLIRLDAKTLKPTSGLAKKWEVSADGKLITFHLNTNAVFQDDVCFTDGKGEKITAKDVKFSFELVCTKADNSFQYEMIFKDRVVGASDFYEKKFKVFIPEISLNFFS